jgi:hypothetical protein
MARAPAAAPERAVFICVDGLWVTIQPALSAEKWRRKPTSGAAAVEAGLRLNLRSLAAGRFGNVVFFFLARLERELVTARL